jgi:hypothetical protein
MGDADYYRSQAKFFAEMAARFRRPDYQERWLRIAQEWRDLAEQTNQKNRDTSDQAA